MLRSASTSLLLRRQAPAAFRSQPLQFAARRTLFTSAKPTMGHRFRSVVFRLGLAGGVVYLYNTSDFFADTRKDRRPHLSSAPPVQEVEEEKLPTIDEIRARAKQKLHAAKESIKEAGAAAKEKADEIINDADRSGKTPTQEKMTKPLSPEEIEAEADEQGAFNEETGEINWDCPCLGGMAHGPCGTEFRDAFSCFVFSKEEPKGMDCIEKFKGMQDCFRKFPEIYGEPETDEEIEADIDEKLDSMDALKDRSATSPTSDKISMPKSKPSKLDSAEPSAPSSTSSLEKKAPVDKAGTSDLTRPPPSSKGEERSDIVKGAPGTKSTSDMTHPAPVTVGESGGSAPSGDAVVPRPSSETPKGGVRR